MRKDLRKTQVCISLSYSDGNFTNNLRGQNISVETTKEKICDLNIDLSINQSCRAKGSNCFIDTEELLKDYPLLKSLEIDDARTANLLEIHYPDYEEIEWKLILSFKNNKKLSFLSKISITSAPKCVTIKIIKSL